MTTFKRVRRFGSWVTFLVLEAFSLMLVVEYNERQNEIFVHSANVFSSFFLNTSDWATGILKLSKTNKNLQEENARLRAALSALETVSTPPDSVTNLHLPENMDGRYEFIPVDVVNKTLLGQHNYFTIDQGTNDNIEKHMGVIAGKGLVGVITNVSKNYSKVMTLLHPQTRISASIKGQTYYGSLSWDGQDPKYMILEDFPKNSGIVGGETVITSGYSNIFPPNIVIGTVMEKDSSDQTNNVENAFRVELINDLSGITYAYIIRDCRSSELNKLGEN